MTDAQFLQWCRVSLDEIGGVAQFYNDPADYYEACNEGQSELLSDLIGGKEWDKLRTITVVQESVADGGTLANQCMIALSVWDAVNGVAVTLRNQNDYNTYVGNVTPGFEQACVSNNVLHTIPAGSTYLVNYIRPPATIASGVTSELSPVVHQIICERAVQILLHKDIDASGLEMIEAYRNKLEVMKASKQSKATQTPQGFAPEQVPYQQK